MTPEESPTYQIALQDFTRARRQAALQQLMARLTGRSLELLAYDDLRDSLEQAAYVERGVREVPLGAIVGSVGRAEDFTRGFLPKKEVSAERWARVKASIMDMSGWDPIEVYQLGDIYFVKDGNHRVSVANQIGGETITARVTEIDSDIAIDRDEDPDAIVCRSRRHAFLRKTELEELRPEANVAMTFCGQYQLLLQQIAAHHHHMREQSDAPVSYRQAVASWYDNVYWPVVALVRERGILRNFPGRTETDLYVLLSEHRQELEASLGWQLDPEAVVAELDTRVQRDSLPLLRRLSSRVREALLPMDLEDGPEPGQWRTERVEQPARDCLFTDLLVPVAGLDTDWGMVDQALDVASREGGRLLGLHVIGRKAGANRRLRAERIGERFQARCQESGVPGEFAIAEGRDVARVIVDRAAWADLVVTALNHPPGQQPLELLGSGINRLVQQSPRPILTVPGGRYSRFSRALLAYDGSPKADEALFVAAYLAARWHLALGVVTVVTEHTGRSALDRAHAYLAARGIDDAGYFLRQESIAPAIEQTAQEFENDLLIVGGYGFRSAKHLVLGSSVDQLLREHAKPILICR